MKKLIMISCTLSLLSLSGCTGKDKSLLSHEENTPFSGEHAPYYRSHVHFSNDASLYDYFYDLDEVFLQGRPERSVTAAGRELQRRFDRIYYCWWQVFAKDQSCSNDRRKWLFILFRGV